MRQATTAEVCVGAGKTARFSVPLPSTASFDRLLPMPRRFAVAQAGQKRDPGLEIAGNLANVGLIPFLDVNNPCSRMYQTTQ